ncbi:MAG: F0F1 ATP synthase subunit gamma [Anaerolineae bacterium]|nr:F0F1 ATP synthase subunit gamma [Anaerolineae bacterium]
MEDLERVRERLDNIRAVEPILGALRTISLGSWQAALRQASNLRRYSDRLLGMLPPLLPTLQAQGAAQRPRRARPPAQRVIMVVGSERGLCGRFNEAVVEYAMGYLVSQPAAGPLELAALGSRAARLLRRDGHPPAWSAPLPTTSLPPLQLAFELARRWLMQYEAHEVDAVDIIHNHYQGPGRYAPQVTRLIPPRLEAAPATGAAWPPPIIETDPLRIYARIVEQWAATGLYGLLLDSAAAEQSTRYQIMDGATKNTERLVEEMTMAVQDARRQEITREMQGLAVGAGLVGPRGS